METNAELAQPTLRGQWTAAAVGARPSSDGRLDGHSVPAQLNSVAIPMA